jgi:cell shape-determining protein MreD
MLKHALYVFAVIVLYVLGCVPGLFVIGGLKPILVVPAAIAIGMCEDEFSGGLYGALAGLLCDVGSFLLFGFNGFVITIFGAAAGLMVTYLMRCNLLTFLLFVFITLLVRGSLEYFFAYGMWDYPGVGLIYSSTTLPTVFFSTAAAIPVFFVIRLINRRFSSVEEEPQ